MIKKQDQAAEMLLGRTLKDGWIVLRKMERKEFQTGGVYSSCYEVEREGIKGFLKAFDYSGASRVGDGTVDEVKNILMAFTLERDILKECNGRCRNIISLLNDGNIEIEDAKYYPKVEYLILEYASQGNIRNVLDRNKNILEWKARSLHQLANGLNQIHKINIAHQDIKPSNVVALGNGETRLTDFGSAVPLHKSIDELPQHLKKPFAGSWEYAPPELLYGELSDDPVERRIGCDLYLLGNMVAYYFTNMNMTALIKDNLQVNLQWTNPETYGRYKELKPYLIMAFENALNDVSSQINDKQFQEFVIDAIRYLCNPDPKRRGHEKTISERGPNYSLERFLTLFSRMVLYFKIKGNNH
jgi:serine/threonine protein kinase